LKYFEKQLIKSGESKTFTYIIDTPIDLSFPDEDGAIKIEKGYFTVFAGNQSARFQLR
jgi:beta-glucosidase